MNQNESKIEIILPIIDIDHGSMMNVVAAVVVHDASVATCFATNFVHNLERLNVFVKLKHDHRLGR